MGTMSASDPAPLPRLGEVFFDVRGSARSLRLSWYATTGVAVFSIWQAGTCTGTFRLPMGELDRMIETLRRGPDGQLPDDDAMTAFSQPHDPDRWDPAEGGPADHAGDDDLGGYPPGIGPYPASMDLYPADTGPYPADTGPYPGTTGPYPGTTGPYPAGIGPPDYVAERTQAHYVPELAGSGYGPESAHAAASTGAHNGETVPGRGRRRKPPDSFRYGSAAGP
jgi:hypothetical protein